MNRNLLADEYPFASNELDFDGVRYHYVDEGTGDPLLLVHGNPTWSFAWRHLIRDLSRDYRVLAVDHIGCGLSDKPADYPYTLAQHVANLKRFVETLDLQNISLFGHDWGGCIGMGMAGEMPERIRRIVLMNTAAFRSQRIPLRIAVCRIPVLGGLGVRGLNLFSRAALSMAVSRHDRMTPAVRAGYLHPYDSWAHRIAVHRFVQDIPLSPTHPSYETLAGIEGRLSRLQSHPMLLIWGEQDWCFTTEFLAEWEERFPDAQVMRIPDAGHYVFEDAHEQMLPRIRQFLAE
ncbi:alpha/beta fold hydrolase [Maioricimonas sp. JC845]|uniref:alpha/beta fold hydrolase n=1 Tax=Maioricimonas sp. JC845 TaxID=3232138 RepID=UPI00345A2B1D